MATDNPNKSLTEKLKKLLAEAETRGITLGLCFGTNTADPAVQRDLILVLERVLREQAKK